MVDFEIHLENLVLLTLVTFPALEVMSGLDT